jgi:hypothetical protein
MKLRAKIEGKAEGAAGIVVPDRVVAELSDSKRPKVKVTVNGFTYRSSIASMGGKFMVGVSRDVRDQAGVEAGGTYEFELVLDTEPRVVTVPADLKAALARDAKAKKFFEGLAYSHQLRHVLAIEGTKVAETRARRVAKAIEMLRAGKK